MIASEASPDCMNTRLDTIKAIQQTLKDAGFYVGIVDGSWGKLSRASLSDLLVSKDTDSASEPALGSQKERSDRNIATLHPRVQVMARNLVSAAADNGINIVVTSGTRTYEEQDALFRQANDGKDNDGDGRVDERDEMVTKARAGHSNHNFGMAFDVTIFDGTSPAYESPRYKVLGALGKAIGLSWGGDWTSIPDEPHFELRPMWAKDLSESEMIARLRIRKDRGLDPFA